MLFSNALRNIRPCAFITPSLLFLLLFSLVGLSGCSSLKSVADSDQFCEVPADSSVTSRISFFLNLKRADGPHVTLQLVSVEILRDALWVPVSFKPRELDTKKIGGWQLLLGQQAFQPGNYEKVRLTFEPGVVQTWQGESSVRILKESVVEIPFAAPFNLQNQASESVFLAWDVDASFTGADPGSLVFSLATSRLSPITATQIYVACPDINTVYAVRSDKKWIDRSFFVAGRPTYIAIDDVRQKLYVLCQEDGDIKVFDLVTNTLTDVIGLPMTFRPKFMWVDPDLINAYVIDDLGHLSVVDLQSGNVVARNKVGQRPSYVIYIPESQTIAVSSGMDSKVYMLDDQTLEVKDQITVGNSPTGILQKGNLLYIAEELSDSVTVYDFDLRIKVNSVAVGYSPYRLAALDNYIYVANSGSGSLSLVRAQNNRVIREIPIGDQVYEMAVSEKEQLLYVGKNVDEDCGGSISVLDITSSKVLGEIEIGSRPVGIAIGR